MHYLIAKTVIKTQKAPANHAGEEERKFKVEGLKTITSGWCPESTGFFYLQQEHFLQKILNSLLKKNCTVVRACAHLCVFVCAGHERGKMKAAYFRVHAHDPVEAHNYSLNCF